MIIGITGKAGSGKSTVAGIMTELVDKPVVRVSFAAPVKMIAREHYGWDGVKDERGRKLLQDIATAGRKYDPDIWVKKAMRTIFKAYGDFQGPGRPLVIIDDLRFENEARMVRAFDNGMILEINKRQYDLGELEDHESETGIDLLRDEHIIWNKYSKKALSLMVKAYLYEIKALKESEENDYPESVCFERPASPCMGGCWIGEYYEEDKD